MGREPTSGQGQATPERELTARPTLTGADRHQAETGRAVQPKTHLAAGKHDAIDQGISGGKSDAADAPAGEEESHQRRC